MPASRRIVELNYNVAAYHGISIMPDAEYILRPGATPAYRNAVVLGLKTHIFS